MTFLGKIALIEPSRYAVITKDAAISYGELILRAKSYDTRAIGSNIFINLRDLTSAIIALLALDGVADEIAVTSAWQERDSIRPFLARSSFDAVICDVPADFPDTAKDIRMFEGLEQLMVVVGPDEQTSSPTPTRWLLTTSGTTGQPKMVSHSLDSLTRSTRTDSKRGEAQIWGMLYDYSRFAGLQVVLQSLLSGATLIAPEYDTSLDEKIEMFCHHGCTHLSATPTMWRKILMTPASQKLSLQQITLGGEIADDVVINTLAKSFPSSRISHIFASTEAGVGFSVTDKKAGFPESYLTAPPLGIRLRIDNGVLFVRNEEVGKTYWGEEGRLSEDGWVNTGDMVEIRNGRVYFKGRASGVINVGGDKVHPEEIEAVILEHNSVLSARVYAKPNPIMGALVVADVVLDQTYEDATAIKLELQQFLKAKLDKYKVPAVLKIVDSLDVNVAGKLQRKN